MTRSAKRSLSTAATLRWLCLLPALCAAETAQAETPQVLSWIRADVDGDGIADAITLRGDGQLQVEWAGSEPTSLRLDDRGPLMRPADVQFSVTSGGRVIVARATALRRGGIRQSLSLAAVASGRRLRVAYSGPVGPVGRDGEYAQDVAITSAGLIRFQTAPNIRRCDGESRVFVERYRDGVGFQPDPDPTLPAESPATVSPQITTSAPAEFVGPALGIYRWVGASAQAHVTRADALGPPRELEDDNPASAWAPAPIRGAFVTAQADGNGHSLRAVRLVAARGKPLPRRVALIFGGGSTPSVDVSLSEAAVQWLVFPAASAPQSDCVSLLVRDGAADSAIGDVVLYSELDGQGGLTNLLSQVASGEGSRGEGAARTLLLRARRDAAGRKGVLDALAQVLQSGSSSLSPESQRRVDDLLLQLAEAEDASSAPGRAASSQLEMLLWSAAQRRLMPPAFADGGAQTFLRALAGYPHVGPRLLLRILDERTLPSDVRGTALALWAAAAPGAAPARLIALIGDAARDAKLALGWSAAVATALRCKGADDPAMAPLVATLSERLRAESNARDADADADAQASAALLLSALSQALSSCPDVALRSQLAERIALAWPQPAATDALDRFALQYRLLQALDRLSAPTPATLILLAQVASQSKEPVLRQVAGALRVRLAAGATDRLAGLRDADAGVRLATLSAIRGRRDAAGASQATAAGLGPAELALLDQTLLNDAWPKVRRAAAEARAAQCTEGGTAQVSALRQALSDRDLDVQRRALMGLAHCEGPAAVEDLMRVAQREDAKASLRGQACALLARHAMTAASLSPDQRNQAHRAGGIALVDLLRDPQADDRHAAALAQCLRGFSDAGDLADLPVLIEATGADLPATVRQLGFAAITSVCGRRGAAGAAASAIPAKVRKALADAVAAVFSSSPDLRLQASARRAKDTCQ